MVLKAAAALTALVLVFGAAPRLLADMPNRTGSHGLSAERWMPMVSNARFAAVNDAASDKESFAASELALLQRAFFCSSGATGGMAVWIKLTEPGGKPIHINLEHITSVRTATQVPGARAQLDLASGKFQGVQEDVEEIMQLISAASGARESNGST
jgi:uncharacterized protein YlzI (FlbEa/FlbD family)